MFSDVLAVNPADHGDLPEGILFPYGIFSFRIEGVGSDGAVTVALYLHTGQEALSYYKFGPTPDDYSDHWYEDESS